MASNGNFLVPPPVLGRTSFPSMFRWCIYMVMTTETAQGCPFYVKYGRESTQYGYTVNFKGSLDVNQGDVYIGRRVGGEVTVDMMHPFNPKQSDACYMFEMRIVASSDTPGDLMLLMGIASEDKKLPCKVMLSIWILDGDKDCPVYYQFAKEKGGGSLLFGYSTEVFKMY